MNKPQDSQTLIAAQPVAPVTPSEATKSAGLFVVRVTSQYLAGQIIANGLFDIIHDAVGWAPAQVVVGTTALIITGLLIFWAQFGYQLSQSAGWTWAANLKWPF